MQRSCGYALRPTLRIDEIERAVKVSSGRWLFPGRSEMPRCRLCA